MTINTPARPRFGESDINNDVSTVIDIEPEPSSSGDNGISPGALAASSWYFNLSNKAVLVFFPIACFVAILHFSSSSNYVNVKNSVREGGFRVVKAGTTRSTKKSYVTRALKIDDDDKSASVTVDRNRACDVPEHEQLKLDKADSWGYFDELIEKNRETVLLARGVEEYTPKRDFGNLEQHAHDSPEDKEDGVDDNLEPSSIPHRLIFTHKDNLLDCDVSSSVNSEPSLHTYAHNVRDTIKSYKEVWGDDMQVTFLTDEDCRRALYDTEPELLAYYDDLAGMFKGDLCRSAELFLNGGYYFDVDILVVHPFVASPSNKFVTVKWAWYEVDPQFFQAFIAAAPGNEIIKKSLTIMLEILRGTRAARGEVAMHMIGTQGMQDAWAEVAHEHSSIGFHGKNKEVYLLSEHRIGEKQGRNYHLPNQLNYLKPGFSDITCNFFVSDDVEKSVYFFSHILGTAYCGQPKANKTGAINWSDKSLLVFFPIVCFVAILGGIVGSGGQRKQNRPKDSQLKLSSPPLFHKPSHFHEQEQRKLL